MNVQTIKSKKLYDVAKANIGQLLSDGNAALGCMITVNNLAIKAWGVPVGGGASTNLGYQSLQDPKRFMYVPLADALPGDIIIAPTGYGKNPADHGHVGVCAQYGILSNSSEDGRLHEQWTMPTWFRHYTTDLGFPVKIYRAT